MLSTKNLEQGVQPLEQLSVERIRQSKYILNAAIIEVLRDSHPEDVSVAKKLIFDILDAKNSDLESIKYALIDGRFLDAAQELFFKAGLNPEISGTLYKHSGVLYAPFMSLKAIEAFELAEKNKAELGPHRSQMARLYSRMADEKNAKIQAELAAEYTAQNPESETEVISNKRTAKPYASNIAVLPITLERDGRKRFSANLDLNSEPKT